MFSYIQILLLSIVIPILFSFEKRIHYVSKWKAILRASIIVAIPFLIWDIIFTKNGIWGFNESYTIGFTAFGLPIEEILFFILIPFASLIFWEISKKYKLYRFFKTHKVFFNFTTIISVFFLLYYISKTYILVVCLATIFTTYLVSKQKQNIQKNIVLLFFVSLPFFLIVNGKLTSLPIVWYNSAEKSGLMIGSIPLEDLFYSYSLLSLNALVYEKVKTRHTS